MKFRLRFHVTSARLVPSYGTMLVQMFSKYSSYFHLLLHLELVSTFAFYILLTVLAINSQKFFLKKMPTYNKKKTLLDERFKFDLKANRSSKAKSILQSCAHSLT